MRRFKGKKRRFAGATVEMAVVTPLLLTMLFGIIEYSWVFSLKQALTAAAREGARTASLPNSTEDDVLGRVASVLNPYGLTADPDTGYRVTVDMVVMPDGTEEPNGTVHVEVDYADVTLIGEYFGSTAFTLGAKCSMNKEGLEQ